MRPRDDENTVWTDSQDYEADEILSHPFILTPPVQRVACALHLQGSPQESAEIIHPLFLTYLTPSKDTLISLQIINSHKL